jgi:hypothetical protein
MVNRRGSSSLGSLSSRLLPSAIIYCGVTIGTPFWKHHQFQDAMGQEVRFAANRTDVVVKRRLRAQADALDLPERAQNIRVRRANGSIFVFTESYAPIEFPGFVREVYFAPAAQGAC